MELKNQPKQLKAISSTLKKEYADTVKSQKKRQAIMEKQLEIEEPSKEERKKKIKESKMDHEKALTLQSLRYERKISEAIEHEITQLDAIQQRRAQEMQERQEKQRKEMDNYHEFRRKGLETARAEQINKLIASHEAIIAKTKAEQAQETKEFLAQGEEERKAFEALQAQERASLSGTP